jgi:hypothetical protein
MGMYPQDDEHLIKAVDILGWYPKVSQKIAVTDFKVQFQHSAGHTDKNHAKSHSG